MKQLLTVAPNNILMNDVPIPDITNPKEVLVKIEAAGICGSDMHIYHGTSPVATYPRVMGHEMTGRVVELGDGVTKVRMDENVIIDQIVSCGSCYPCKAGRPNVCCNLLVRGVHIDGGYSEYVLAHEDDLHILPAGLSFTDAVMIEPMSIAFQACARGAVVTEDTVLILGGGALGKSLLKAVKITGAKVIVADIEDERLTECKLIGADLVINSGKDDLNKKMQEYTTYGPTVSFDAAGFTESLSLLADITCNAGRIVTMGFLSEPSKIAQYKITSKELDVRGSRLQNGMFKKVINSYKKGEVAIEGQVNHIISFIDAVKTFKSIGNDRSLNGKIVFSFDE